MPNANSHSVNANRVSVNRWVWRYGFKIRNRCARVKKNSAVFFGTLEWVWSSSHLKGVFWLPTAHFATSLATRRKSFWKKLLRRLLSLKIGLLSHKNCEKPSQTDAVFNGSRNAP